MCTEGIVKMKDGTKNISATHGVVRLLLAMFITVAALLSSFPHPVWAGTYWAGKITRVSLDSHGRQANEDTARYNPPTISTEGRYIAFSSDASNLVPGDTNGEDDIFVYDLESGTMERVSVGSGGIQGHGSSSGQAISADGRYVAFSSFAGNLVPDDTNSLPDVFVHDRQTGETERVSVASDGTQGFMSSQTTGNPSISADGRFVAFSAEANNLAPGEDTNVFDDIFVHDRLTGETEMVSVTTDGFQASGTCSDPTISANGRYVAFESVSKLSIDDTNNESDVFVHDRDTGVTELVSLNTDGTPGEDRSSDAQISGNGRYVVYERSVDIFLHDRLTDRTEMINATRSGTEVPGWGNSPTISADGRFVAYQSTAVDLVPESSIYISILLHDRQSRKTYWVSSGVNRTTPHDSSNYPVLSADGNYVAFMSFANNLVPGDTNNFTDVFLSSVNFRISNIFESLPAILQAAKNDKAEHRE